MRRTDWPQRQSHPFSQLQPNPPLPAQAKPTPFQMQLSISISKPPSNDFWRGFVRYCSYRCRQQNEHSPTHRTKPTPNQRQLHSPTNSAQHSEASLSTSIDRPSAINTIQHSTLRDRGRHRRRSCRRGSYRGRCCPHHQLRNSTTAQLNQRCRPNAKQQ